MKRIGLICVTALMGMSLAACNNSASQKSSDSSSSSHKTMKVVKHHKKQSKVKNSSSFTTSSNTSSMSTQFSNNQGNASSSSAVKQQVQQNTQISNSSNTDPHLADGTDVYDLPYSDPRNPDSYKQGELMDIAGDPKYQNPDGSMNEQGAALASSIEDTFHQPQH